MKMTFLRRHDAQITLSETAETRITVTLAEALPGRATAVYTFDLLQIFDADIPAEPVI